MMGARLTLSLLIALTINLFWIKNYLGKKK